MAEDKYEGKRGKILQESLENSNQPSWGYFGVSGSLAIGDNSYAPIIKRKPKEEEEVAEPMPQMLIKPPRRGVGPDAFFTFETGVNLGDPYQDAGGTIKKGRVQHLDPEAAFKPPGKVKSHINKLGYEYKEHLDTKKDPKEVREKYRDFMPPRQILSNPPKKGGGGTITEGVLFGYGETVFPSHMADDYDAPKKLRAKELKDHLSKVPEQPFRGNDHGYKSFQVDAEVFKTEKGSNVPKEMKKGPLTKAYPHEAPFRPANPAKWGVPTKPINEAERRDYLGGVYEYMGDPEVKTQRKPKNEEEKAPFRGCGQVPKGSANPMPSVVCNTRNMRRERPASFARPTL